MLLFIFLFLCWNYLKDSVSVTTRPDQALNPLRLFWLTTVNETARGECVTPTKPKKAS